MATPQPPLDENEVGEIVIDECITNPQNLVVLPPDYHRRNQEGREDAINFNMSGMGVVTVDVVNKNPQKVSHAYMRIQQIPPVDLCHHYPGWGMVYFGIILPRVQEGVYHLPTEEMAQKVAIKRLSKPSVMEYLQKGGNENPLKEIQRMQWLGDNRHVLGLVEALHDDDYLYIIMPYCEGGSLVDWIFNRRDCIHEKLGGFAAVYLNLLENLEYIHSNGICHRDVSPDNCMVLGNGRIVFVDLAMSFRIPPGDWTTKIGDGIFGKPAYLPPEIVSGYHYFGARMCDLWGSAVILFNLITGEIAWRKSLPNDARFRYLVLAGGLSRVSMNERTIEILDRELQGSDLRSLAEKCVDLNPLVSDLLAGILQLDPNQRWDINQAKNCIWIEAFQQLG
jgi:serine/threonine protein kinase